MTDVVGGVDEVDEVASEVVGELGEERLGLGLGERAHCGRGVRMSVARPRAVLLDSLSVLLRMEVDVRNELEDRE